MPIRTHVQLLEEIRASIVDNEDGEITEAQVRARMIDTVDTLFGSPTTTTIIPDGTPAEPQLRWDEASSAWTAASSSNLYFVLFTSGPADATGVKESEAILGLYDNGGRRWPPSQNIGHPPAGYVEPPYSARASSLSFVWNTSRGMLETDQITNVWSDAPGTPNPVFTLLVPSWYGMEQDDWFFGASGSATNPSSPRRPYPFETFRNRWVRIDGVTFDAWSHVIDPADEARPTASWLANGRLLIEARQSPAAATGHTFELVV